MKITNESTDDGRFNAVQRPRGAMAYRLHQLRRVPTWSSVRTLISVIMVTTVTATSLVALSTPATAGADQTATQLVFSVQPASGTGGSAFATQPVVTIEDASNAVVTGDTDTVTLSIQSGTGASGAVLTCPPVAAVAGVATFTGCSIDKASTTYQLQAVDGSFSVTSSAFTVAVGAPAAVNFVKEPTSIVSGTDFAAAPSLAVEDAGGNIVTSSTDTIGLAVLPGVGFGPLVCSSNERAAPAGYAPGYKLTAVNGVATFDDCTINKASTSSYVLATEATDGTTAGTFANESSAFAVTAGAASQLVFTTQPTGTSGGSAFATQPVVSVEDAAGNVVASATTTISLAITAGTGPSGATLTCNPVAAINGVASFSGCSLNQQGNNYTLTASGGSLTGTSAPFNVNVSSAAHLSFGAGTGNATGGSPLPTQPVVTITDSGGNPVSGAVTLSLTGGTAGAALSCPTNPSPAGTGTATFAGCTVNLAGNGYQLVATDADAPSITTTSASFNVTVGAAAQIAFTTPPSGATGGSPFTTQPTAAVEDLGGNPVPSAGLSITLSLTSGTGSAGAALACSGDTANTATTSTGSATFSGCAIDKVGSNYQLTATAGSLLTSSPAFNVSAGNAAQLKFINAPAAATVASPFGSQPEVVVADAGGNPVGPVSTTVALTLSAGTINCTTNPISTPSGLATFSGCEVPTPGNYTLTASAPGLASATTAQFTVVAGAPIGTAPVGLATAQTFGAALYSRNTTDTTDDVNSATGALEFSTTDLNVAGLGEGLSLVRNYNSADTTGGAFGTGWSSIFDAGVTIATGGKTALVRGDDGQQLVFSSNGSGGWIAPAGARESLVCSGTTCTVTRFDGVTFQSVGGHIQNFLAPGGEGLHFIYTKNLLTSVTVQRSTTPLTVAITENATGQITKVASPTRSVSYRYTNGNLTGYTDADGNAWTYTYGAGLTQEIDPSGHLRLVVSYSGGRVISAQAEGSSKHFDDTYSWNAATQTSTRLAAVTTATGPTTGAYIDQYKSNVLISQEIPDGGTTAYSYDNSLDLTEVQDPLGHIQQMSYDAAGDLVTQSSPWTATANAVARFGYDAQHRIISSTDQNGNTTTYTYTGVNLAKVTPPGPANGATTFLYNSLGERTEADSPTGIETFSYDAAGNQTGYKLLSLSRAPLNGLGPISTFDEAGDQLTSTDARGNLASGINKAYTSTTTYDAEGNSLSVTTPGPQTTVTTYTTAGDVATITAANGTKTTYTWNEANLTSSAATSGGTTTTTYDPSGDALLVTDGGGRTTATSYDTSGRQITSTSTDNITTTYTFNVEGQVVATSDTAGNTGTFTYGPANQKLSSTLNGVTTSVAYDAAGNVSSQTDGSGNVISYIYNSHEKLASVKTAAGTTTYAYDLSDNLSGITDGDGHTTAYTHNGAGQLTAMIVNGHTTSYTYDLNGNLIGITDPDGRSTKYTVNAQDLRSIVNYSQAGQTTINITESYNAAGQRTQMTDPTTGTHNFSYDSSGDLTSAANGSNNTYSYNYSTPGSMTETYPDNTQVSYGFDDAHNVMSVTSAGVSVSYLRNTDRQITGIAYSNGLLESQSYNQAGQMVDQTLTCAGSSVSAQSGTSYNADGAPVDQESTLGSTSTLTGYGYDGSGRVTAQSATTSTAATPTNPGSCTSGTQSSPGSPQQDDGSGTTSDDTPATTATDPSTTPITVPTAGTTANPITYDAVGNRTTDNGTTTTYNAANEVATQTGAQPATYTYDNNGDVTSETTGGVTTTYSYNAADQLVKVVKGATTVTYSYDGDGNRVNQTVTTASVSTSDDYSWDPSGNVPLLTLERTNSNGLIRRYIYGVGPVAMETPAGTYYLTTDAQGDVTDLSDSTGAILENYSYDAYGNVTSTQVGSTVAPTEPVLFQSQYLDTTTGLYNMRARNYDPTTGRFTQRDPVMASPGLPQLSPYIFANDEPTSTGDPTGQASSEVSSAFSGHSTESANTVTDVGYGLKASKLVVVKPVIALAKYAGAFEEAGAEAGRAAMASSATLTEAGEAAERAGSGADVADVAGKALGVIGIGLSIYVTVEDCEHGTVSQCVGDTVGAAVGLACIALTEGIGAIACGLVAAGLSFVISKYGPQIAAGLEVAGDAIAAVSVAAWNAVSSALVNFGNNTAQAFTNAALAINGAFDTAGAAIASAFSSVAGDITDTYNVVAGAISTGFNKAVSAISSGFNSAVDSLEQAGYTALQMASVLKNEFNEGIDEVVNQLGDLEYDVDGVANAIEGLYNQTAQEAGVLLNDFEYTGTQIADGLKTAYADTAAEVGAILQTLNKTADQIAGALDSAYQATAAEVGAILQTLNYAADEVAGALDSAYQATAAEVGAILNTLSYTANQIAGALDSAYQATAAEVASILNTLSETADQIAGALDYAYQETDAEVASILNDLDFAASTIASALESAYADADAAVATILNGLDIAADTIASALESAYGDTAAAVASVLQTIGDTAAQIAGVLTDVFNEATSDIESALSSLGFTSSTIDAIGSAFSSFGNAVVNGLDSAGSAIVSFFSGW